VTDSVADPDLAGPEPDEPIGDHDTRNTRMQRFWSWLAVQLGKRAGLVALIGLLVTLIAAYGTTKLTFATGQDSYLNSDDQVAIDNVEYQDLFGGEAMLVLITADPGKDVVDIASAANLAQYTAAAEQLKAHPESIEAVVSPTTGLEWSDRLIQSPDGNSLNSIAGKALQAAIPADPTPEGQQTRTADGLATLNRVNAIPADQRTLDNPEWVRFLLYDNSGEIRKSLRPIFPDQTHAQMVVRLKGNASIEVGGAGADLTKQIAESMQLQDATVIATGAPALLKDINDYLRGGMLTLGAIAVVIMALILLIFFDVRWRLLPLAVVLVGVTWAFGLAGYLGIPLSLVTIAGLPVMLGVGIDYAIQMHARVEEEVVIDRNPHPIQETARNLCPALLVVTFDAVFAFTALRFAKVPMIRQFGLLLAVGIAVICFASIIVPLATLGIREYKSPTKGRDFREGFLGRFVVRLGSLPIWMAPIFAVASLAIFVGGIAVEDKLTIQSDPIQWVDQSSETIRDIDEVTAQTGSSSELGIFVQTEDIFSQQNVDFMSGFAAEQLAAHPDQLLTASSVVTTVQYLLDIPGAGAVTPRSEDIKAAYEIAPADIKASFMAPDQGAANLVFRYGVGSLEERAVVIDQIEASTNPPEGITATPSGLAVVGVGLLENIEANRILLTYLAIAFVGIFLMIRLRSVVRSLLSLIPVLIAVGAASLVAWAFNLKLSPMTAVGGPLVVAICTEFTSLILLRFIEERHRGLGPRASADVAASRTGRAFIVSGMTAAAGVGVIATSNLPLLRDFGIIVAMNVFVALASALIVLPPLLVWADNRGWVSKHMIPDRVLKATTPKFTGVPEVVMHRDDALAKLDTDALV
jgi:hydrophobe/amphiphile efflux-3 (HAE3) family protein